MNHLQAAAEFKPGLTRDGRMNESIGVDGAFDSEGLSYFEWTVQRRLIMWRVTWNAPVKARMVLMQIRGSPG